MTNKEFSKTSGSRLCDPHSFSVPVEGKKHFRQTLLLALFTLVWAWALAQQSRATAENQADKNSGQNVFGLMIETGSNHR